MSVQKHQNHLLFGGVLRKCAATSEELIKHHQQVGVSGSLHSSTYYCYKLFGKLVSSMKVKTITVLCWHGSILTIHSCVRLPSREVDFLPNLLKVLSWIKNIIKMSSMTNFSSSPGTFWWSLHSKAWWSTKPRM